MEKEKKTSVEEPFFASIRAHIKHSTLLITSRSERNTAVAPFTPINQAAFFPSFFARICAEIRAEAVLTTSLGAFVVSDQAGERGDLPSPFLSLGFCAAIQ